MKQKRNAHWVVSFRMKAKLLKIVPLVFTRISKVLSFTRKERVRSKGWEDGARRADLVLIVEKKSSFDEIVLI